MKVRRTNKDSYGLSQAKNSAAQDFISKNGELVEKSGREEAFKSHLNLIDKVSKTGDRSKDRKKTGSGDYFKVSRLSKNPFKEGINLRVDAVNEPDVSGRPTLISTTSKDSVKAFKEYLKLKDSVGLNEKIDNKEIKDEIRRVAKKKAIQRGAIVGGTVVGGTVAAGIGAKKLYDKKKKKK